MVVTNLYRRTESFRRSLVRNPVATLDNEFITIKGCFSAHHHAIVCRIQFDDIQRSWRHEAKTFALANSVEFNAVVMTEHAARRIDDFTAMFLSEFGLL